MTERLENYLNSIPDWYSFPALFLGVACGYMIVWAWGDGGMFGSSYYFWKMIRAIIGLLLCFTIVLWPIPFLWWIGRMIVLQSRGLKSEWDEVVAFEKRWPNGLGRRV